jgi:hypothetical protein
MVDFATLRNQILFGEGVETPEREPGPTEVEALSPVTGVPLFVGAATLIFSAVDKAKFDLLGSHRPMAMILFGVAPLAFGLGRLSRGRGAQEEIKRYESLLEATQSAYEAELESEEKQQAAEQQPDQMGYLEDDAQYYFDPVATASNIGLGTVGVYGDAIGQEPFSFEANDGLFAPRVSYESQTFGW